METFAGLSSEKVNATVPAGGKNKPFFSPATVQPKLTINQPNDSYEQEADAMADKVMRMEQPGVQLQPLPIAALQRKCAHCEEEDKKMQRKEMNGGEKTAGSNLESYVGGLNSGGQSLSNEVRNFYEPRFGYDFSNVKIHTDTVAAKSAQSINALAYTSGNNIVFNSGQYSPGTDSGKRLLGHELTHVVQQNSSIQTKRIQRTIGDGHDLTALRFKGDAILEGCFDNERVLKIGAKGEAVRKLQQALVDAGFPLPKFGVDGDFGSETETSVRNFQNASPGLVVDGIVGPQTMGSLDVLFTPAPPAPAPPAPAPPAPAPPAPTPVAPCPLGITGPQQVDHYCAAYVPSDAASCGTFPAPNITLTATGMAAGAALRWSVSSGATKASIVGPVNGTTAVIKGDAPSATAGDVTISVSNGTCTATRTITVREPSHMTSTQAPSTTPTLISNQITYTVQDQFNNAMGAGICVDETITVCHNSLVGANFTFGDAATNASGQVTDNLSGSFPGGVPAGLCVKLNQTITAGGCGPLLRNTILFRNTGITLLPGTSCAAGDACP
ncbi:eCIS core domain-containing protein [Ferruginibacter profundus]